MSFVKPSDSVTVQFTTTDPSSGAATDADSLPTGTLVRNGANTAESVTVQNITTGVYSAAVTIPAGYAAGDEVQIRIAATVGGTAGQGVVWSAQVDSKRVSELNDLAQGDILSDATAFAGANVDAAVSSRATPAQVNAEALDVLDTDTFSELASVPAASATLTQMIRWLYILARNKIEQTSTTQTVRADDGTTTVGSAGVSDDGTTAQRNEWS